MRFIITFLNRRASGRTTRRSRTVEQDAITFGRATSSDVHLPDLAVGLDHARLTVIDGRVHVEALGERPVRVRNVGVGRTAFPLADPAPMRMGPYAVSIAAAADAEGVPGVEITVEQVEAPAEALSPADEERIFSLAAAMPGKRRLSWLLFLTIALFFLALPVLHALSVTDRLKTDTLAQDIPAAVESLRTAIADLPVPIDGWADGVRAVPLPTGTLSAVGAAIAVPVARVRDWLAAPIPPRLGGGMIPSDPDELKRLLARAMAAPDHAWDSGPVSRVHANIAASCTACHRNPFEAVDDSTCLDCHRGIKDHARPADLVNAAGPGTPIERISAAVGEQLGLAPGRCGSCHREHNGNEDLVRVHQAFCGDCHRTLTASLPSTRLLNATDFGVDHPQFRPTIPHPAGLDETRRVSLDEAPRETSGLKFSHAQHLAADGGVTKMARELGTARGYGAPLDCAQCHTPDAAGALFEPIRMDRHCSACHDLTFELDDGYRRVLPHGQPRDVAAMLRDHFLAGELERAALPAPEPGRADVGRRRPGERAVTIAPEDQVKAYLNAEEATARALERAFSAEKKGLCVGCHDVSREAMAAFAAYRVAPVRLAERYLPLARFDHAKHGTANLTCASCHAAARSTVSADVLLPPIGKVGDLGACRPGEICSCRNCHAGEDAAGATPSACLACHVYHGGSHAPTMVPARLAGER